MDKLFETSSFELNAILRGAQLTLVGANRALQNPGIFTSEHYKQAALAVAAGIVIRILVAIPTLGIRLLLLIAGLFTDLSRSTWGEDVVEGIDFIEHSVLQVPFFLMSFMRYLSPAMDHMFMDSIRWTDETYNQKHKSDDPAELRAMYYPNLRMYDAHRDREERQPYNPTMVFLFRSGRKAALSLAIYALTFLPYVGRFVLPAASFYTFNNAVGLQPAVLVFASGLFVPKRYLVLFLQSYFSSRTLMRELLQPYFSRIHYTSAQKKQWFHDREGVLYGFAIAFFFILKVPLLGVLIYGIAEASTAYLVTKITSPPPPPGNAEEFMKTDVRWHNKHEFINLPLDKLDLHNIKTKIENARPNRGGDVKGRQFT